MRHSEHDSLRIKSNNSTKKQTNICPSCDYLSNVPNLTSCTNCGYVINKVELPHNNLMNLAVIRGLVKAAPKIEVMLQSEWAIVEKNILNRNDAFCPICMEGFKDGREILLSCSHMFHRKCLTSFEMFMKRGEDLSCPICRTSKYQKKFTRLGSKAFEIVCIIKIQAFYRGYNVRKHYQIRLRSYYQKRKGNISLRKKFYQKEFSSYTDKLSSDVEDRGRELETMIRYVRMNVYMIYTVSMRDQYTLYLHYVY